MRGGKAWTWRPRERWIRIYHRDDQTPGPDVRRGYGPLLRFDHHTPPAGAPRLDPMGRTILYAAKTLRSCGGEVFGDADEATICPHYYAALIRPVSPIVLQDVQGNGSMLIGALPALGSADVNRLQTQAWARAIYEDRPASPRVSGVRYTSSHDEGACLALWDTAPAIVVVNDFPLAVPGLFRRFTVAMRQLGIESNLISTTACLRCRSAAGRGHPC